MENNFSMDQESRDGLGMIQVHYICCVFYFFYYCISSRSDHQSLVPITWGPLS